MWQVFEYVCAYLRDAECSAPVRGGKRERVKCGSRFGRLERRRAMRMVKWNAFLSGLCAFAVALGAVAASAYADVTTEKGASILIFPKVRATATFDTIIQITNTG